MRGQASNECQNGFTLLEIIITLTVIAILATVAVPNYLYSKLSANEGAAIAALRAVTTAQVEFKAAGVVDLDHDGVAEHGTLSEMAGASALRGSTEKIDPSLLPMSMGTVDGAGRVLKAGYFFTLYLPDSGGIGLAETPANAASIDTDLAENHWTCIAWPSRYGASGLHTYFVNQQGTIVKNEEARYSGTARVPAAGCAMTDVSDSDHIDGRAVAINTTGSDGTTWHIVQ